MKLTVTISNKHLQEIFYRHNLPETAETSVTNETICKAYCLIALSAKGWDHFRFTMWSALSSFMCVKKLIRIYGQKRFVLMFLWRNKLVKLLSYYYIY